MDNDAVVFIELPEERKYRPKSETGSSCHQCHQKDDKRKVKCTNILHNVVGADGPFPCGTLYHETCLLKRYDIVADEVDQLIDSGETWLCPR